MCWKKFTITRPGSGRSPSREGSEQSAVHCGEPDPPAGWPWGWQGRGTPAVNSTVPIGNLLVKVPLLSQ